MNKKTIFTKKIAAHQKQFFLQKGPAYQCGDRHHHQLPWLILALPLHQVFCISERFA